MYILAYETLPEERSELDVLTYDNPKVKVSHINKRSLIFSSSMLALIEFMEEHFKYTEEDVMEDIVRVGV